MVLGGYRTAATAVLSACLLSVGLSDDYDSVASKGNFDDTTLSEGTFQEGPVQGESTSKKNVEELAKELLKYMMSPVNDNELIAQSDKRSRGQRFCGPGLTSALSLVCNSEFNKRSPSKWVQTLLESIIMLKHINKF